MVEDWESGGRDNMNNQISAYEIHGLFPIPIYRTHRELDIDTTEKKEIEDIIAEGMSDPTGEPHGGNCTSHNSYIFNTKLKKLKEFCEEHVKQYVKETINPKEELEFYITQSWLNVTKPGESHQNHSHANSIISGAFYIETDIGQTISCYDPNQIIKQPIMITPQDISNFWNAVTMSSTVEKNMLMLFPSWLEHGVQPNKKQTKDVISISFNTFVRGNLGERKHLNQLILQ